MGKKSRDKAARRERPSKPGTEASAAVGPGAGAPRTPAPRRQQSVSHTSADVALETRVRQLLAAGQPEQALDLIQSTPASPGMEAFHRDVTAQCLLALHRFSEAYPLLLAASTGGTLNLEVQLGLAEAEANLGMRTHAVRRIRKLTQTFTRHPAVVQAREFAQTVRADLEQLAASLDVSVNDVEEASFLFEASHEPMRTGDYGEAIRLCREALEECPELDAPHLTIANAYLAQGQGEAAATELQSIADHDTYAGAEASSQLTRIYTILGEPARARAAADVLLALPTTPLIRPVKAEALAYLGDHEALRALLRGERDLSGREQFLLGVASAKTGDIAMARRSLDAAAAAGHYTPLVDFNQTQLENDRTDLRYHSWIEVARPETGAAIISILSGVESDPEARTQALMEQDPALPSLLDTALEEDPGAAIRLLAFVGTEQSLQKVREYTDKPEHPVSIRLMALSYLRDVGEIAEDEPLEFWVGDQVRTIVLGNHRIMPDRSVGLPSHEAAQLFQEGNRLLQDNRLEEAYDQWLALEAIWPSPYVRTQLARIAQGLDRMPESREWLNKTLAETPGAVEARLARAIDYMSEGRLRPAMEDSRVVEETSVLTMSEFLQYQYVRESLDTMLESPLADALMAQADMAPDAETAEANRELAGMLGSMQKSLALTQYLRQRPIVTLSDDLKLVEVTAQMDNAVVYNAAWLFGLLPEIEELQDAALAEAAEPDETEPDEVESDEAESDEDGESIPPGAREMLARELLSPDRLAEGLPGLPDNDLEGLRWLLDRGGMSPLDEYLREFPVDEIAPGDMLLEYGIVAEGRLHGKMTRMVPVDLRAGLVQALGKMAEEA